MKGFILDSDTWIEFFRHRGGVDKHIAETPAEQIFASEVSLGEFNKMFAQWQSFDMC